MTKLIKCLFIVCALLSLYSCEDKRGPESVLKRFVDYRFVLGQTRDDMLSMTTGVLNINIAEMTDEEFKNFSNMEGYKLISFNINIKKCEVDQCYLTYIVKYSISKSNELSFNAEIKKIADMRMESGSWKIADISNIKTFYDSKKPIFP